MKNWQNPELNKLGVQATAKSHDAQNSHDGTTYDSDGNYWESRS